MIQAVNRSSSPQSELPDTRNICIKPNRYPKCQVRAEIQLLLRSKLDILSRVHKNLPSTITLLYIWVLYLFVSRLCRLHMYVIISVGVMQSLLVYWKYKFNKKTLLKLLINDVVRILSFMYFFFNKKGFYELCLFGRLTLYTPFPPKFILTTPSLFSLPFYPRTPQSSPQFNYLHGPQDNLNQ